MAAHDAKYPYDRLNYAAALLVVEEFRSNESYRHIRIKADTINGIFNTSIRDTFGVSRQIFERVEYIDRRLVAGDASLVHELAVYEGTDGVRANYSFATKYCHCHQPNLFPIYDRFVARSLVAYQNESDFAFFSQIELRRDFEVFRGAMVAFRLFYGPQPLKGGVH